MIKCAQSFGPLPCNQMLWMICRILFITFLFYFVCSCCLLLRRVLFKIEIYSTGHWRGQRYILCWLIPKWRQTTTKRNILMGKWNFSLSLNWFLEIELIGLGSESAFIWLEIAQDQTSKVFVEDRYIFQCLIIRSILLFHFE